MRQRLTDPLYLSVSGQLDRRMRRAALRLSQAGILSQSFVLQDVAPVPGYHRQFEEWAGDFSGRYIGALAAYARYSGKHFELLHSVAHAIPRYQRETGMVGSDLPADATDFRVIWGQGRLLSGLLEYHASFPSDDVLTCACLLGDYYAASRSHWRDPAVCANPEFLYYTQAIQPLVALYRATGQQSYLDTASHIGRLWLSTRDERSSGQHSHATLLTLLGLLELFDAAGDERFLQTVRHAAGEINAAMTFLDGAPPEFFPWSERNEGCSTADWFELNLRLGLITEMAHYFEIAERVYRNALCSNQGANGGFGHRNFRIDRRGYTGEGVEAWWCCSCHGLRGLCQLLPYIYTWALDEVRVQFFEPSTIELPLPHGRARITQETQYPGNGETMLRVLEAPARGIRVHLRLPGWATRCRVSVNGRLVHHSVKAGYVRVPGRIATGDRIELAFSIGLRLESGEDSTARIWYGPLLMTSQMPGGSAHALAVPPVDAEGLIRLPLAESASNELSIPGTEFVVIGTGNPVSPPFESLAQNQPQFGRLRPLAAQTAFASPPPTILEQPVIVAETPTLRSELAQLLGKAPASLAEKAADPLLPISGSPYTRSVRRRCSTR